MYQCNNINKDSIVAGLGNFDGVHIGHQHLIKRVTSLSKELKCLPSVITFDPHPQQLLDPKRCPLMLLTREEKERKIMELGVNSIIWLPFSRGLAGLSPEDFVRSIILDKYNCRGVVVGYNYTFGAGGEGTADTMLELGNKFSFDVSIVSPVSKGGLIVSSTAIRKYIMCGDIDRATVMLGGHPSLEGQVVKGDGRGKKIGFPTANLNVPQDILIPGNGVYAVRVNAESGIYLGVANIGTRPTFYGAENPRNIEVHLLDFCNNLYGKKVKITFKKRIRGEKAFGSVDELVRQIKSDIAFTRSVENMV